VIKLNNRELDRSIDDVHKAVVEAEVKAGHKIANDGATDTDLIDADEQQKKRRTNTISVFQSWG